MVDSAFLPTPSGPFRPTAKVRELTAVAEICSSPPRHSFVCLPWTPAEFTEDPHFASYAIAQLPPFNEPSLPLSLLSYPRLYTSARDVNVVGVRPVPQL